MKFIMTTLLTLSIAFCCDRLHAAELIEIENNNCFDITFFYNNISFECDQYGRGCSQIEEVTSAPFDLIDEVERISSLIDILCEDLELDICIDDYELVNLENSSMNSIESFFKNTVSPWHPRNIRILLYHNTANLINPRYSSADDGDFILIPLRNIFDPAVILHEIVHKYANDDEQLHVVGNYLQGNPNCPLENDEWCMNLMYESDFLSFNFLLTRPQSQRINLYPSNINCSNERHLLPSQLISELPEDRQICCNVSDMVEMDIDNSNDYYSEIIQTIIENDDCLEILIYSDLLRIAIDDHSTRGMATNMRKFKNNDYKKIRQIFQSHFEKHKLPKITKILEAQEQYFNGRLKEGDKAHLMFKKNEYVEHQLIKLDRLLKGKIERSIEGGN